MVKKSDQIQVLKNLVNKSVREGQKEILKLSPVRPLPRETKKQVTPTYTHVSFNMSQDLEKKLENIKTLLGPKAYNMSLSQLIEAIADLASQKLQENKFGKKRTQAQSVLESSITLNVHGSSQDKKLNEQNTIKKTLSPTNKNPRYISQKLKHHIWFRYRAQCTKCKSKINLHLDHIRPVAFGGTSTSQNLRLLCFHCNQRQKMTLKLKDKVQVYH